MKHMMIGRALTGVKIADDKKAILFQTPDGDVIARADGDCCSSTWIEHVELPARGFPCEVISVEDLEMPEPEQPNEYEVIAAYGCKITTDKGEIVIDYRNESNGYYGGDLVWPVAEGEYDPFYGGVFDQNVSTNQWVDVSDT